MCISSAAAAGGWMKKQAAGSPPLTYAIPKGWTANEQEIVDGAGALRAQDPTGSAFLEAFAFYGTLEGELQKYGISFAAAKKNQAWLCGAGMDGDAPVAVCIGLDAGGHTELKLYGSAKIVRAVGGLRVLLKMAPSFSGFTGRVRHDKVNPFSDPHPEHTDDSDDSPVDDPFARHKKP